ncbi:hypothetical protein J6590_065419 [Homalodisca vitripennis]|nr:hypothetical protein J6590_065419 [Homalodisca vitripennis]
MAVESESSKPKQHFNYHLTFSVILGWTRQHSAPRQIFPFTLTIPSPISDAITYRSSAIALLPFRFEGREGRSFAV